MLEHLIERISRPLNRGQQPDLPPQLTLFHCLQPQHLRNVPLHYPALIFVLAGTKTLHTDGHTMTASAGNLLLLPSGHVTLSNLPPQDGRYLALTVACHDTTRPPAELANSQQQRWVMDAPDSLWLLIQQWLDAHQQHRLPDSWHLGRYREVREVVLSTGQGAHLLPRNSTMAHRLLDLFYSDFGYPWQLADVAERLHCSAATLQRQLAREGTGFRDLLEQVRMAAALGLLQDRRLPVQLVAERVGYRSASRFSERFRAHYGLLPSALKDTHNPP